MLTLPFLSFQNPVPEGKEGEPYFGKQSKLEVFSSVFDETVPTESLAVSEPLESETKTKSESADPDSMGLEDDHVELRSDTEGQLEVPRQQGGELTSQFGFKVVDMRGSDLSNSTTEWDQAGLPPKHERLEIAGSTSNRRPEQSTVSHVTGMLTETGSATKLLPRGEALDQAIMPAGISGTNRNSKQGSDAQTTVGGAPRGLNVAPDAEAAARKGRAEMKIATTLTEHAGSTFSKPDSDMVYGESEPNADRLGSVPNEAHAGKKNTVETGRDFNHAGSKKEPVSTVRFEIGQNSQSFEGRRDGNAMDLSAQNSRQASDALEPSTSSVLKDLPSAPAEKLSLERTHPPRAARHDAAVTRILDADPTSASAPGAFSRQLRADHYSSIGFVPSSSDLGSSSLSTPSIQISGDGILQNPPIVGRADELHQLIHLGHASLSPPETESNNRLPTSNSVQPHTIVRQVAESMQSIRKDLIEITLDPPELGRVRMSLSEHGTSMSILVQADQSATSDLLRRHQEMLRQDLMEQGYHDVSFTFEQQTFGGQDKSTPVPVALHEADGPIADEMIEESSSFLPTGVDIRL